jgi:hypothetical protein
LRTVPRLDGVTPFITQADLGDAEARLRVAQANDPRSLVLPLFGTVLPDPGPQGTLDERLIRALETAATLEQVALDVQNQSGALVFHAQSPQDGMITLAALHAAWQRQDPHVLPGVLALLEWTTARVTPVLGPKGVSEGIAAYWHSLDQLRDCHLPERLEGDEARIWKLSDREVVRIARRLGLPHAWQITDALPYTYFRNVPDTQGTLTRLTALVGADPLLAPLPGLLRELVTHAGAMPDMTDQEHAELPGLPMPHTVVTVSPRPYCMVAETADEYVRNHWEAGEDHPQVRLDVRGPQEYPRLAAYLAHAPQIERLTGEVLDLLVAANDARPAPKVPRPQRRG